MRRLFLWGVFGALAIFLAGGAGWILSLPAEPDAATPAPVARAETEAAIEALKPPKRQRPVIAIVGLNNATETTDYLMPYGILRRADVGEVMALAAEPGPVTLYPALRVSPDATLADFDQRHPDGADYVIVPAMSRDDDPAVMSWLKDQAAKGAIVISVCAGAKVIAAAGLLDGKRATTHWYYLPELRREHPSIEYVADRRMVVDGRVATTTGITASMPMMLTLIEAIAGRDKAEEVARDLGLTGWDASHDSDAFRFSRPFALTAIGNTAAFWDWEKLGIDLTPGIDEVSLALVADAWSRTYKSSAVALANATGPVETRNGMRIIPDDAPANWPLGRRLTSIADRPPAQALDEALRGIRDRYGARTADFVADQLEYAQPQPATDPSAHAGTLMPDRH